MKRTGPILDKDGKIVTHFYLGISPIYGEGLFNTLEEAKEHVKRDILPKVYFSFYDFNDERYYTFTVYEAVPIPTNVLSLNNSFFKNV